MNNTIIFETGLFRSSSLPLTTMFIVLAVFLLIGFLIAALYYLHERQKKEHDLQVEMKQLELHKDEKNALYEIVKRNAISEPIEVLYSLPLFDELAQKEIARVLSSPLSSESKSHYVNLLYEIRRKTYFSHPDDQNAYAFKPISEALENHA